MIELIEVYSHHRSFVETVAQSLEAKGYTILSVAPFAQGRDYYLITARQPVAHRPLGSNLQKGLRLAVVRLSLLNEHRGSRLNELLSLSALAEGHESIRDMDVIESALARLGK